MTTALFLAARSPEKVTSQRLWLKWCSKRRRLLSLGFVPRLDPPHGSSR